tara:strand:- start:1227 stop:1913 length:687 start_codon:yes stop_codon:yes gene_type:complete
MRTLYILYAALAIAFLNSCTLHKNINYRKEPTPSKESVQYNFQNYREYKKQETQYYQYVLKNNSVKIEKDNTAPIEKEKPNQAQPNHRKDLIQVLENKGLKPCKLVEKALKKSDQCDTLYTSIEIIEDPVEESKPKKGLLKNKSKEYRQSFWQGFFRIVSIVYFTTLSLTNFHLFTILLPTSICLLASICYPIWWKRGYLDNPYAKIATFIAAYGGLLANILWIILYL